jgi:hypothetical protein
MLDEQIDDIIREAASQHHPPYNDKAWDKMEDKLNTHLPQKGNNQKRLGFFLLLFLVGGGAFFAGTLYHNNKEKASIVLKQKSVDNQDNTIPSNQNSSDPSFNITAPDVNVDNGQVNQPRTILKNEKDNTGNVIADFSKTSAAGKTRVKIMQSVATEDGPSQTIANTNQPGKENNNEGPYTENKPILRVIENIKETIIEKNKQHSVDDVVNVNQTKPSAPMVKHEGNKEEKHIGPEKKTGQKKNGSMSRLGISISAGPDVSYVGGNTAGKSTMLYGAGIQYAFSKRLSISTGFYIAKKIYAADSASYKMPAGFYPNYYRVQLINANCKVFEIPVNLYYNFGAAKKHHWFAGTGISSYLMKDETYNYDYKYGNSPNSWNKEYEVYNQNNHWFSVLTLSAGYLYQKSKKFSFTAAPYFKLPLTGVGIGKIKLNSTGILFTAIAKPF